MTLPKPRRSGGFTGGPPSSRHSMRRSPEGSSDHVTVKRPPLRLSAPYFAALVIISWNTSASAW